MGLASGISGVEEGFKSDPNLNRARRAAVNGARALPSTTSRYLLEKVPIFQWLPNYSVQWLLNDIIAGLTVGVLLVPQALAYAKIATIPLQDGLLASWLPSALYFFMGTSKDISVGPTSIIGLLTAQIVKDVSAEGFTPTAIATAVSFSVGIYSLVMGLFKLGFLLDFISLPVLTGFVGAAGLTILIGQIPAIFGETVGTGVANQIHDIVVNLPKTKPLTFVMGASAIVMLFAMQFIAKKWGKKNKAIWVMGIGRNAIVLVLFTGISYGVNKDLKKPLFDLTSTVPSGLVAPVVPDTSLVGKVFSRSVAVFIAAALEHIAIAKSFARRNGYVIDESQELTFLGTTNLLNSIFGGMAVGGAFSRTAVNSESGVKSPLSGLFTTATVIASIYFLTGALFWVPKATLSAVIIAAVWQILVPVSVFYKYWKTSLADFTASQIAFWVTLFVSAETGIEGAAAFMIVITLLRNVFGKVAPVSPKQYEAIHPTPTSLTQPKLPAGVALIKYTQALTYLNAYSTKAAILGEIQTNNLGAPRSKVADSERLWSDQGAALITFLRQRAGISSSTLPHLRMVILDFSSVAYIDTTGIQSVIDLKAELVTYGGPSVELRFACVSDDVAAAFERAGWLLAREGGGAYASVIEAVNAPVMTKVVVDGENDMMRKGGNGEKGFEEVDHEYDDAETVVYRNRCMVSNYLESDVGGGGKI